MLLSMMRNKHTTTNRQACIVSEGTDSDEGAPLSPRQEFKLCFWNPDCPRIQV